MTPRDEGPGFSDSLSSAQFAAHFQGGEARSQSEADEELARGRELRRVLDAKFDDMGFEQRATIARDAKAYRGAPLRVALNLGMSAAKGALTIFLGKPDVMDAVPDWKVAYDAWRTRKIWRGGDPKVAEYAALIRTEAYDPTRGTGDRMLVLVKNARLADREATRNARPKGLPIPTEPLQPAKPESKPQGLPIPEGPL